MAMKSVKSLVLALLVPPTLSQYRMTMMTMVTMMLPRSEAATAALVLSRSPSRGARRLLRHSSSPLNKPGALAMKVLGVESESGSCWK